MVDRITQSPSHIPIPKSKSPKLVRNGKCANETLSIPILSLEGIPNESNGNDSGVLISETNLIKDVSPKSKVPKANVPKDLFINKHKDKKCAEKGFETFLMTGDMIIKKNPSLKLRKMDGTALERHHSDSSPCDHGSHPKTFKRSASSPDQTTFTGTDFLDDFVDNSKSLSNEITVNDETSILRKASAESGFEDQTTHSDTGTLEKTEKLPNDPTSVSDLSELESDDLLGNMAESQCSIISNSISSVSTPSDLKSDISVNTVLQQEVEPLLSGDSSSSSIEISSTDSSTEELTPEVIFERSMSDSGGMSPINQQDVTKCLITSKSVEKIIIQKPNRQLSRDSQLVRASKSQENYVGEDVTFVCIDIDDTAYSLDQIPQQVEKTPTQEEHPQTQLNNQSTVSHPQPHDQYDQVADNTDDRVFMPGFIKLEESAHSEHSVDKTDQETADHVDQVDCSTDVDNHNGYSVENTDKLQDTVYEPNGVHGAQACESDFVGIDNYDGKIPALSDDELFALPPVKSVDHPSAKRLAKRLYNLDGFRKSDVSRHLSKKNDFSTLVAEEYLKFFDFSGDTLDVALRKFLKQFSLIGETQERERVLAHFSRHYIQSNSGSYNSEDACHTLVCAIMLLNTDLHGQAVGRKMTCGEFIENLAELNDGENFPKDILKALYHAIKAEPIEWAPDEEFHDVDTNGPDDLRVVQQSVPSLPNLPQVVGRNPFLDVPDPSQTVEYKKGYIMRKCCVDPDGRKTAVGKRGWKMFFVVLRDMILYLYKDEQGMKKSAAAAFVEGSHNAVRIHHCLASKASDYTKKQHVLRLQTADWAEYLFQTSNTKELQEWIDTLNYVAASLSAPPLPGAVGSQKKFQRPLLPVSYTRLNMQDQVRSLEERLEQTELDLQEHRTYPPEKGSKSSIIQHYVEKETYLEYEVKRLKTYIYLLQSKLSSHSELEPSLVETSIGEDEEGFKGVNQNHANYTVTAPGLKKPSAVQRSISDRENPTASPMSDDPNVILEFSEKGELINPASESTRL